MDDMADHIMNSHLAQVLLTEHFLALFGHILQLTRQTLSYVSNTFVAVLVELFHPASTLGRRVCCVQQPSCHRIKLPGVIRGQLRGRHLTKFKFNTTQIGMGANEAFLRGAARGAKQRIDEPAKRDLQRINHPFVRTKGF